MADVTDRGQMILIMGLVLAVAFVALVPLLNTVIYTENLASRGTDVGGADAIEAREATVDGIAGLVWHENNNSYSSRSDLETNVNDGLDELEFVLLRTRIKNGVVIETSDVELDKGALVLQTETTRRMYDKDTDANWTLVSQAVDTRDFVVNITDSTGLQSTSDPETEAFEVLVTDGSNEWHLYVYENVSTSTTAIAVKNASQSDPTEGICSPSNEPQINLINGTVDGTSCSAIEFAKGVGTPYDIEFVYGNRSIGTFELTANLSSSGSPETTNLNGAASGTSPYWEPVVYTVRLDFLYETYPLTYRSRIRITPEAPA